jgi:formylglycine-generating enzyme required for sulfatase activity
MRFSKLLLPLVLFLSSCISFRPARYASTVKMGKNFYVDQSEIPVHAWLTYYNWILKHEGTEAALKVLPDSNAVEPEVWELIACKPTHSFPKYISPTTNLPFEGFCIFCPDLIEKYHVRSRYRIEKECSILYYPITGLTYEQTEEFCKWRSRIPGEGKITYRLPTFQEWTYFAKSTEYPDSIGTYKNNRFRRFNYKIVIPLCGDQEEAKQNGTSGYDSGKTGLDDIFGNVSEMTATRGLAKGGNYSLYASQCHPDSVQYYNGPSKFVGFRCIAFKTEKKKS